MSENAGPTHTADTESPTRLNSTVASRRQCVLGISFRGLRPCLLTRGFDDGLDWQCSLSGPLRRVGQECKGAITSKIKHAIKLKTSPARLAQLLPPSLAFCFSLQPMTAHRPVAVRRHCICMRSSCLIFSKHLHCMLSLN